MAQAVILIPARYESSRFPGKPLTLINGQPMIQMVYQNMAQSGLDVAVVTDNDEIEASVNSIDGTVYRIDDDVPSGSERIGLAVERNLGDQYDYIINVQGDEPLLSGSEIKELLKFHESHPEYHITTLAKQREGDDIKNPDIVKIARAEEGNCFYFSRAPIPFDREASGAPWLQHIGVYCYKTQALKDFLSFKPSKLEDLEKLEQLRALENGLKIGAYLTESTLIGVDRPEDVSLVEKLLQERK